MRFVKGKDGSVLRKRYAPGQKCPACNAYDKPKGGILIKKYGSFGFFISCSRYPDCKFTSNYG